jgi:hypothetical protein
VERVETLARGVDREPERHPAIAVTDLEVDLRGGART